MTIFEALVILSQFRSQPDNLLIEAIEFLATQELDAKTNARFREILQRMKWSYKWETRISDFADSLKTNPGFLADAYLWQGWQYVLDMRAKVAAE